MRLSIKNVLVVCFAASLVEGKLNRITKERVLSPEDVGAYHTDAFELLGNKYSLQKPKSIFHAIADVGGILAGYCPEKDSECITNAYKITKKEFEMRAKGEEREITYPDDFDPRVKESINAMVSHVESIEELNLDDVINSLRKTKEQLEDMTDVKESDRLVGLTGASVAMESTKLWHSTHYDDEHPLHDMIDYFDPQTGKRRLQILQNLSIDIPGVTLADFWSAVNSAMDSSSGGNLSIFTSIVTASAASAAAFFTGIADGPIDDEEEVDEDDGEAFDDDDKNEIITNTTETDADVVDDVFDNEIDDFLCSLLFDSTEDC